MSESILSTTPEQASTPESSEEMAIPSPPDSIVEAVIAAAEIGELGLEQVNPSPALGSDQEGKEQAETSPTEVNPALTVDVTEQVRFQRSDDRLLLFLPTEAMGPTGETISFTWNDTWHQLKHRLNTGERFWEANTPVYLVAKDRLLDTRQLQSIAEALAEAQLQLRQVETTRRQTAVAAATAGYSVEQNPTSITQMGQTKPETGQVLAEPLYLQTTLRSGIEVRHPGTVVLKGDVNPGSAIVADGDIIIWGRLRGVAHAGAKGNTQCQIMVLQMEPTQLRIADYVARAPQNPLSQYYPEVAYVAEGTIRISPALNVSKGNLLK